MPFIPVIIRLKSQSGKAATTRAKKSTRPRGRGHDKMLEAALSELDHSTPKCKYPINNSSFGDMEHKLLFILRVIDFNKHVSGNWRGKAPADYQAVIHASLAVYIFLCWTRQSGSQTHTIVQDIQAARREHDKDATAAYVEGNDGDLQDFFRYGDTRPLSTQSPRAVPSLQVSGPTSPSSSRVHGSGFVGPLLSCLVRVWDS